MREELVRAVFPKSVVRWVKRHPGLANFADRLIYGPRDVKVFNGIKGMLHPDEREFLYLLAKNAGPDSDIVEVGCYAGLSTYFLGKGALLSGSSVYSVDPFSHEVDRQLAEADHSQYVKDMERKPSLRSVEATMQRYGLEGVVTLIQGFSEDVAASWNNGEISFLWIDGNHLEAYKDFRAWSPHLAPDCVVAFHDSYGRSAIPEVARDVERIIDEEKPGGVVRVRSITKLNLAPVLVGYA